MTQGRPRLLSYFSVTKVETHTPRALVFSKEVIPQPTEPEASPSPGHPASSAASPRPPLKSGGWGAEAMKRYGAEGTRLRVCPRWHLERGEGVRSWGLRPSSSPPSGGSAAGGEGAASALGKETPGLQPRLPEASGGSRTGHVWWGMWLSHLWCVPIGQEPATCPSGDQPLLAQLPPLCLRALGPLCGRDLSLPLLPLMLATSSLRGGPLPREAAIPSLPCHAQITSVLWEQGRAPGSWSTVASPTPRHLDVWDWALGEPGAE